LDEIVEIKFLSEPYPPPLLGVLISTCPVKSVGLGGPPPVRELSLLCRLIKREQSHWGRPPMTHKFGKIYKKINYRLNRPKIGNVRVSI
jgi:hypothetical protein